MSEAERPGLPGLRSTFMGAMWFTLPYTRGQKRSPHPGQVRAHGWRSFYRDAVENVAAWLDGQPMRLLNPEALG